MKPIVFDWSTENKQSLNPDASLISNVSDGVQAQNIPVHEKLASSGIFLVNVNRAQSVTILLKLVVNTPVGNSYLV